MLSTVKGTANSPEIFRHLVGETIKAAFLDGGHIHLVMASGAALVLGTPEGNPAYWVIDEREVDRIVSARRERIVQQIDELSQMDGIDLPKRL